MTLTLVLLEIFFLGNNIQTVNFMLFNLLKSLFLLRPSSFIIVTLPFIEERPFLIPTEYIIKYCASKVNFVAIVLE